MSRIPEARDELLRLAGQLRKTGDGISANRIEEIVREKLHRKDWKARAYRSVRMTVELGDAIRAFADTPEGQAMPQQAIAERFGVNSARVSEALSGTKWI